MIKVIKIIAVPWVIVISKFDGSEDYFHYWLSNVGHKNPTDVGCWRIKYNNR